MFNPSTRNYVRCSCEHGQDVQQQGFTPTSCERVLGDELPKSKLSVNHSNHCRACDGSGLAVIDYATFNRLADPHGLSGNGEGGTEDKERVYHNACYLKKIPTSKPKLIKPTSRVQRMRKRPVR
jgi:hypothetical protein